VDFLVDSKACCAFGEAVEREDIWDGIDKKC
jgi:hypothetical protein